MVEALRQMVFRHEIGELMTFTALDPIQLTPVETELLSKIPLEKDLGREHYGPEKWALIADAMMELFDSLNERGAIPEIRLSILSDPEYAEKGETVK